MPEILHEADRLTPGYVFTAFEVFEWTYAPEDARGSKQVRLLLTRDEEGAKALVGGAANRVCRKVDAVATADGYYIVQHEHYVPVLDTALLRLAEKDLERLIARLTPYERQLLRINHAA